jgi:hypothetical protein
VPILLDVSAHAKFFEIPNRKILATEPASPTKSTGLLPKRSELQEGFNTATRPSGKPDRQSTPLKDGATLSYRERRILLDGVQHKVLNSISGGRSLTTRPE